MLQALQAVKTRIRLHADAANFRIQFSQPARGSHERSACSKTRNKMRDPPFGLQPDLGRGAGIVRGWIRRVAVLIRIKISLGIGLVDFPYAAYRAVGPFIARRVDDSVARVGVFGPTILRRARGYAPGAAATFPTNRPILALGADLKNTITLVVRGQAFVSQHIGDLDHYESFCAFQETIRDLLSMYEVHSNELLLVHDLHPQYASTIHALELSASNKCVVQHHRAHIASVLAERAGSYNSRA